MIFIVSTKTNVRSVFVNNQIMSERQKRQICCYILVFGQLLGTGGRLVSKMQGWANPIACVKRACAKSKAQNQPAICPTDTLCSDEITATRRILRTTRPRNYTRVRTALHHFMMV